MRNFNIWESDDYLKYFIMSGVSKYKRLKVTKSHKPHKVPLDLNQRDNTTQHNEYKPYILAINILPSTGKYKKWVSHTLIYIPKCTLWCQLYAHCKKPW